MPFGFVRLVMIAYKTKSYVHLVMIRSAISLWQIVISGMSDACRTWPLIRGPTCGEKDHTVCDRSTKISFCHATWTEKGRPVSHPSQVDAKPSLLKKATSCDLSAFLLMKRCQPPTGRCSFTYIYIYNQKRGQHPDIWVSLLYIQLAQGCTA